MRYYILSLFLLGVLGISNAQQSNLGVKGGLNISKLSSSQFNTENKVGFYIGGFYEYFINSKISVQPEILFSTQGGEVNEEVQIGDIVGGDFVGIIGKSEGDIDLTYLNIPVLLKFYPAEKLFLEIGPQFGFNLSSKYDIKTTIGNESIYDKGDIQNVKSVEFGLAGGFGYYFTNNLGLNARYVLGLTDIADENDFQNKVASFGIMYRF